MVAKKQKRSKGAKNWSKASKPASKRKTREALDASSTEADESQATTDAEQLDNPALFEDMNQERIPKLEKRGRLFLIAKDTVKRETAKRDELDEECQLIMEDYKISSYNRGGVHLKINVKKKLEGSLD